MTLANAKPDLLMTGPLGNTTVNAASSAWHDVITVEAKITAAVAYAVSIGAKYCYVPDSFLPYTASLVTFNAAVVMLREGGPHDGTMDLRAYGVTEDGVTDVTTVLQTVENLRAAGQTLRGSFGKTYLVDTAYDGTVGARANLLKMKVSGTWDFTGCTIKYGSASPLTTGVDGLGLGVINILASDTSFIGAVDCNSLARYA